MEEVESIREGRKVGMCSKAVILDNGGTIYKNRKFRKVCRWGCIYMGRRVLLWSDCVLGY